MLTVRLNKNGIFVSQVVLNCIMDIHRSVFMWGQQEQIKREEFAGTLLLTAKRNGSGITNCNH